MVRCDCTNWYGEQPQLTQDFSENENQNHSDIQSRLLSRSTNTRVTNNTNSESAIQVRNKTLEWETRCFANLPGSKTSQTDRQTSTELNEASVERKLLGQVVGDQDGHNKTVDTNDTRHDNGDNV